LRRIGTQTWFRPATVLVALNLGIETAEQEIAGMIGAIQAGISAVVSGM